MPVLIAFAGISAIAVFFAVRARNPASGTSELIDVPDGLKRAFVLS